MIIEEGLERLAAGLALTSSLSVLCIDDIKKFAILKNGIGIEGQKSTQTS